MLYPNFNDLVAMKGSKADFIHSSSRRVKSSVPGNHHSPFRGSGLMFDSVREYVPGDDIRRIDWRVTARKRSPHLKLFKDERERHIVICVDMNASMRFGTRNTFKSVQAARIAAFLGWKAIAQQDRVSACLFGDVVGGVQFFAPNRTKKSLCELLKCLTEPPSEKHHVSIEEALRTVSQSIQTGSLIYLISDFMELPKDIAQEAAMSGLSRRSDLIFISMNDQADQTIPPIGTIGFCEQGRNKVNVNTDSVVGRQAYEAQWNDNRQKLNDIVRRLKIPLVELTTESEIQRDLAVGLRAIAKRK